MTNASPTVVAVRDLRIVLEGGPVPIVDDISFDIRAGEVLGLIGESGSGKTTLGMALLGYCRPGARIDGGTVLLGDEDVLAVDPRRLTQLRGGTVAYVPQDPATSLNPALRVGSQLREVLRAHTRLDAAAAERRVTESLAEVDLPADEEFLQRFPHQLSGGQQQRIAIAMAFACRPRLVVCDEPTTGLDVTTQARVLATLKKLCREHRVAALYVSHDLAVVGELADELAVLSGRVVERGPRERLFRSPRHPYTRRLLMAVPDLHDKRLVVGIPGQAAMPGDGRRDVPSTPAASWPARSAVPQDPAPTLIEEDHLLRCRHPLPADASSTTPAATIGDPPESGTGDVVLHAAGLSARYGRAPVLFDVDLELHAQESLAIVGPSGSGKTTTARCLAGLHHQQSGEVVLGDEPLDPRARRRSSRARRQLQYVFQNPYASLNPRRTIAQTLERQLRLFFPERASDASRIGEVIDSVALSRGVLDRLPDELSGGERQRVAIARALIAEPVVLVCDEITSALDVSVQASIIQLLRTLQVERGLSTLFITHDLAVVREIADSVMVMDRGSVIERGTVDDVLARPRHELTRRLLSNTPASPMGMIRHTGHSAGRAA